MRLFVLLLLCAAAASAEPVRLLVITGSHPFDPRFYALFENQPGIEWDKKTQTSKPCAAYTPGFAEGYDAVLLYDFEFTISDAQKQAFEAAFGDGRGLIVLHHALCSHPEWPLYREIAGGQFLFTTREGIVQSIYTGNVAMSYEPAKTGHAITRGVQPFQVVEEPYKHVYMAPDVEPILISPNPESDRVVAWTRMHGKSRVAGIAPGHGGDIFVHPEYRKLIGQAILWAAGRDIPESAAPQPEAQPEAAAAE